VPTVSRKNAGYLRFRRAGALHEPAIPVAGDRARGGVVDTVGTHVCVERLSGQADARGLMVRLDDNFRCHPDGSVRQVEWQLHGFREHRHVHAVNRQANGLRHEPRRRFGSGVRLIDYVGTENHLKRGGRRPRSVSPQDAQVMRSERVTGTGAIRSGPRDSDGHRS
jgi:hypothetical protein